MMCLLVEIYSLNFNVSNETNEFKMYNSPLTNMG